MQWKANYTSMLEVVGALRYDNYKLESGATSSGGDRLSPKITVGLLPTAIVTPYVSYAEGYRAPSITETLVDGRMPPRRNGDTFFRCPSGTPGPAPTRLLLRSQSEPAPRSRQDQGNRL